MVLVDVPMYIVRWKHDTAIGKHYFSLADGMVDAWDRRDATQVRVYLLHYVLHMYFDVLEYCNYSIEDFTLRPDTFTLNFTFLLLPTVVRCVEG